MKRRGVLIVLGAGLVPPLRLLAQDKVRRVGFLAPRHCPTPANPEIHYDTFVRAMQELGYVQGKNLVIEWRCADGKYERLPGLAAELVAVKPEVIATHSTPALEALQRSTSTIPVVAAAVGNPVGYGFATSLARPGGNVTGLTVAVADSEVKHVELLKIAVPQLSRFAFLGNPGVSIHDQLLKSVQSTAKKLQLTVVPVGARTPDEIDLGFNKMSKERVGAVLVHNDAFFIAQRRQIAELALKYRLPSAFDYREDVIAGGLMSYGQDNLYAYRRAAIFVDKILKGAKPADLPFEQPTKLNLTLNRKTAKALGITLPRELLLRADEVIGLLWNDSVKPSPYVATLLLALNEKGYAVGRNLRIEDRVSLEGYGQMGANAAALVGAKVDLIVANGRTAVTAAAKATKLIPIVAIIGTDPVSLGLAASLAHPGGNVTGVMTLTGDLAGKRMELLKELVPPNSSVGILYPSAAAGAAEVRERGEAAAKTLGLKPVVVEVRSPDGIENAIAKLAESGVKGIYFPGSTMLASHSSRLVAAVARHRIPAVYSGERFAEAGALVSHGTSIHKLFSKAAVYADRILKGARPGDLPIEQPNVFDLTVNLKTARAQGIKVPQSILVRADKVIE